MNLIGKIFIVLIFIMSLAFMSFAVAVYHTHQNWRLVVEGKPDGLKFKLHDMQEEITKLKEEGELLRASVQREKDDREKQLGSLNDQLKALRGEYETVQADRNNLKQTNDKQVAMLTTEGANLKALTAEVEGLRKEIRAAQGERDKSFSRVVALTDENVGLTGQLAAIKIRSVQLAAEIAAQKKVLESVGLTKDSQTGDPPPRMRGKVLAVNPEKMIEISLGSDDGLREGHTLEVFRGSKYLGRVEVMSITFNRAVAKIVPGYQQGVIQKGDDVATRLKVS